MKEYVSGYEEFNPSFNFVFNSYYETVGKRVVRTDRGNLSRPSVSEVYRYRDYVGEHMLKLLETVELQPGLRKLIELGIQHEQQHQELLATDIKYILGHNPLFPRYIDVLNKVSSIQTERFIEFPEGLYEIGYTGEGFCFEKLLTSCFIVLATT